MTENGTVIVDGLCLKADFFKMYVTKELTGCGLIAAKSGFNYVREVVMEILISQSEEPMGRCLERVGKRHGSNERGVWSVLRSILSNSYVRSNGFEKVTKYLGQKVLTRQKSRYILHLFAVYIHARLFEDYYNFTTNHRGRSVFVGRK